MFLIPEFLVEDKNLPKVLAALTGLALELKAPRPVANAKLARGKVVAVKSSGNISGAVPAIAEKLREMKIKELAAVRVRDIVTEVGGNPSSYSYFIRQLVAAKVLKKTRTKGIYTVIE